MASNENMNRNNRLIELGGSDFEIADGQPDIRGWSVRDTTGQMIGEVEELLIDPQSLKVRYLVVDLEGNVLDLEPRDVLVPIGIAELHDANDDVILPGVTAAHFQGLPKYDKDNFNTGTESSVRTAFAGLGAGGAAAAGTAAYASGSDQDEDFYSDDMYNQDNLYKRRNAAPAPTDTPTGEDATGSIPIIEEEMQVGKRVVETGGAIIRSRVREQEVEKDLELREEHVTVDRTPADRPASAEDLANVKEGEFEIIEHSEVPVVDKEARVVEEIHIRKEVEEHDEVIRDTVRRTDVDIEDLGGEDPDRTRRLDPDRPQSN